jgi:hypothetical protein
MTPDDAEEYTQALGQVASGAWRQIALGHRLGVPQALGLTIEQWVNQRLGGYVRYSIAARREAVAELTVEGKSTREIGAVLGVDHRTVLRDRIGANAPAAPAMRLSLGADGADAPRTLPTEKQWADLDAARARSQQIQQHRREHPDQFAAEEIFSVLTFALDEADKWAPHVPSVAKTPPGQWALLCARLDTISALVRRMCDATRSETHRADAGHAAERGHAPPS